MLKGVPWVCSQRVEDSVALWCFYLIMSHRAWRCAERGSWQTLSRYVLNSCPSDVQRISTLTSCQHSASHCHTGSIHGRSLYSFQSHFWAFLSLSIDETAQRRASLHSSSQTITILGGGEHVVLPSLLVGLFEWLTFMELLQCARYCARCTLSIIPANCPNNPVGFI